MTTVELFTAAFQSGMWGGFTVLATVEVALTIFECGLRWASRWLRGKEDNEGVSDEEF